jgi:hypothetical protein
MLLVAVLIGAAGVAAGIASSGDSGTVTADPASVEAVVPTELVEAEPASTVGPHTDNGTFLVPTEVAPGTYRAEQRPGLGGVSYYEICATLGCDAFGTGTLIANGIVDGTAYVVIPDDAVSVALTDLTLTITEVG